MTDETDRAPWTVKGITVETREIAKRAANSAGLSVGEWLAVAVRQQADRDRDNAVIPPGKPDQPIRQTTRALALTEDENGSAMTLNMTSLAEALRAAVETAQAADKIPQLRGLSSDLTGMLRDQLRAARGMSPVGRRSHRHEDGGVHQQHGNDAKAG